jgi:adenylosuccinate lyase
LALTQAGLSREGAYQAVQRNAMQVWEAGKDFQSLLKEDSEIAAHLSAAEIDAMFDMGYHTKQVDVIFARVFPD